VSTAAGIAVAIVAIWLYNYFNGVIDDIINDMSTASQELEDFMEKDVLRRAESRAAK
jgi:biopolymer transport protein ExbB/TolQ